MRPLELRKLAEQYMDAFRAQEDTSAIAKQLKRYGITTFPKLAALLAATATRH